MLNVELTKFFILLISVNVLCMASVVIFKCLSSESELFTSDTSKDNHSPGPVFREVSP